MAETGRKLYEDENFDDFSLDDFNTLQAEGEEGVDEPPQSERRKLRVVRNDLVTPADFTAQAQRVRRAHQRVLEETPNTPPVSVARPIQFSEDFFETAIDTEGAAA